MCNVLPEDALSIRGNYDRCIKNLLLATATGFKALENEDLDAYALTIGICVYVLNRENQDEKNVKSYVDTLRITLKIPRFTWRKADENLTSIHVQHVFEKPP